jgi:hypothetical protein
VTRRIHDRVPPARPSLHIYGDGEDAPVVAADLSPRLRAFLPLVPDADFVRFGELRQSRTFQLLLKVCMLERCGTTFAGQWQYRLTDYGRAVRDAIR